MVQIEDMGISVWIGLIGLPGRVGRMKSRSNHGFDRKQMVWHRVYGYDVLCLLIVEGQQAHTWSLRGNAAIYSCKSISKFLSINLLVVFCPLAFPTT